MASINQEKMSSDIVDLLPSEIIVRILEDKQLGFSDVINLASTCKNLYKIIDNDNILWRTKYFQRWPSLRKTYHINKESEYYVVNWKERIKFCLDIRNMLFQQLSLMSSRHYNEMGNELPNSAFKIFDPLFKVEVGAQPFAYYILVDELISLIKAPALASNLTHRYYGLKVVRYLKQSHLKEEWQKFISLPPSRQTLERGATIVAQWSQPERHVTYSYIASLLDAIAEQTKALLKEQHPDHSIFSTPPEQFAFWRNNIIDDNQWNVLETVQATEALRKVLFHKLGFYGSEELFYSSENSFLDRVLENRRGIPISLAIVFESVARRLGVRCEPVCFPSHFLLRWKETYGPDSDKVENFYIDVMNDGEFITKKQCPQIGCVSKCPIKKYNVRKAATAVEVIKRMASNLEVAVRQHIYRKVSRLRSTLELEHMVQPNDPDPIWKLASLYRDEHIDFTEILDMLKIADQHALIPYSQLIPEDEDVHSRCYVFHRKAKIEPKKRKPVVEYAVGMIMKYLEYPCVIIGWDTGPFEDELGAFRLNNDAETTKYIVLRDGMCQYVYQDELHPTKPEWIDHQSIGRYFCKFDGTHYVPNEDMAKEYPEDEEARNRLLQSLRI